MATRQSNLKIKEKLVLVRWEDSMGYSGWKSRKAVDEWLEEDHLEHITVGIHYKNADKGVVVALSVYNDDGKGVIGDCIEIPYGVIKEMIELKLGKKLRRINGKA